MTSHSAETPPPGAAALEDDLRRAVRGGVKFDAGTRALYAADASNYRHIPIGVVWPRDADDTARAIDACRAHGAPIVSRGGGTGLAGQTSNAAVVLDFSRHMTGIVDVDAVRRLARVQPGVVLDRLREAAEEHHLTFGPDPATHDWCTLGGMIGNNSCGVHSVMAGRTADNVEELEILTYDGARFRVGPTTDEQFAAIVAEGGRRGQIYSALRSLRDRYADLIRTRYPKIPRRVSGYNLDELLPEKGFHVARALVGSEGTCVTVLEATLQLVPSPPKRSLVLLGYPDVYAAAEAVPEVMATGPVGLEGMDEDLIRDNEKLGEHEKARQKIPEGKGWLVVEFGGATQDEAHENARRMIDAIGRGTSPPSSLQIDDPHEQHLFWKLRESGLGATARVPGQPDAWPGWEDSAVPPERMAGYLRDIRALMNRYEYKGAFYGHFGQGCLHTRITFDLKNHDGALKYRAFVGEAADVCVRYGGSLSGEHGDGQSRAELLPKMFGPELVQAFREFKSIWDPRGRMNPGKIVEPYRILDDLRLGPDYRPAQPEVHFAYSSDQGGFSRAVERCVGVGKCRKTDEGTMCPSYMVTREEMHSTRGRAHLLHEMLRNPELRVWKDPHVKEALDLCLACKGCRHECPMKVDMATYKAEFLSHYYKGRLRPRSGYAMGLIYWWARAASLAPGVVNFFGHAPLLKNVVKFAGGFSQKREIPRFARQPFRQLFERRERPLRSGRPVLLWPDTFNNFFHPEVLLAATEVLESAGFEVLIPSVSLCCGRPLYDFGWLDRAKKMLLQILHHLADEISAGIPVVGLEPSCVSVFRDEMINLLPTDEGARRLHQQTYTLAEFLEKKAEGYEPPRLDRRAIIQGHCHHKAVMQMNAEENLLRRMGVDFELLDSGCCGMAGAFGFENGHYDVSIGCGERVLLPRVRGASRDTLVIADGFSCREQIRQTTDRRASHLAEVLRDAWLDERSRGTPGAASAAGTRRSQS